MSRRFLLADFYSWCIDTPFSMLRFLFPENSLASRLKFSADTAISGFA